MGRGGEADVLPTPPGSARSARSGTSVRSAASYRKLENRHATQKLADLIVMQVQMESAAARKKLGRKAKAALIRIANGEAKARVSDGSVNIATLPSRVRAGFLMQNPDPVLAAAIDASVAACKEAMAAAPAPAPAPAAVDVQPNATLEVELPGGVHPKFQRRLPPVNVAGKPIPLEQLIRDKIMQRGMGGAHQLRKAFQVFDADGNGLISVDEMEVFLKSINLKVARTTLCKFFEIWAGEKSRADMDKWDVVQDEDQTTLNYMEFIQKILPADYPNRDNMFADDIASMAFEDRAKPLGEDEITTQREFEQAFRDKVAARSSGGGAEQMKQFKLFDEAGKGFVNFDDLMRAAKRWNLCASTCFSLSYSYPCRPGRSTPRQ